MKIKICVLSSPSLMKAAILSLLMIWSLSVVCRAEGQVPAKLSVNDAVSMALGGNAKIKQAEAIRLSALSSLKVAGFTTSYGVGYSTGMTHSPDDSGFSTRAYSNIAYENLTGTEASLDLTPFGFGSERGSVGLTLRRPLGAGSGQFSRKADLLAGARSDASVQEKQLYLTQQTTVLGVVDAYYQAVLAREQVKVQERAVSIAEEAAVGAKKRADAGLVSGIDVSRAEIRVARTRDQLNLQKQSAHAAKDRLMSAIGSGVGEDPELTEGIPGEITNLPGLGEAVQIALSNRAEFAIYDEQLVDQKRKVAMAKDQFRPKLDFVAGFNSLGEEAGIISGSMINMGDFRAGLEYHVPLDRRVMLENRITASRDLDILDRMRVLQMEAVTEQVRSAYRNVETSKTTLGILSENVKVAEDNLRLAQRMVEEGIDDNRIILDAQDSLTQVEIGLLSARIDLYLAGVSLRYAMGQDLTDMGSK